MKRLNEANAIKALLEILPYVTGGRYENAGSPDDGNSQEREVDFILRPDSNDLPCLAVEHTIVEAFRGQMEYVNRSYEIVHEVDDRCRGKLPPDRYFILMIPHNLVELLRKKAIDKFLESIVPWVVSTAQKLVIDEHSTVKYSGQDVLLMCGGSHPEMNGSVGRIPGSPKEQKDLAKQSLWFSIAHGLGKFSKYKRLGQLTVLMLENISGAIHSSMLLEIEEDPQRKALISNLVDYIIVFASNEQRMVVGNLWKEKELRYSPVPFNRRFGNREGKWVPFQ